jgi:hypothetical protein
LSRTDFGPEKPTPKAADDFDAERQERAIYEQMGRFIVAFQALENELFQICWLLAETPNDPWGRGELADLGYYNLVSETGRRVHALLADQGREDSGFAVEFHRLLRNCRRLGRRRNGIVHSAYVFLEGGGKLHGIVRSDMRKGRDGEDVEITHENLNHKCFEESLKELAMTAFGFGQSRRQLIFWLPRDASEAQNRTRT